MDFLLLRCRWWQRCSDYIFILDFTPCFNELGRDNCKTRRESLKICDLVCLILEILQYLDFVRSSSIALLHVFKWQCYVCSKCHYAVLTFCREIDRCVSHRIIDNPGSGWIKHFYDEINFIKGKQLFCCFWLFHILIPHGMILCFRLPYFHVFNSALLFTWCFGDLILYRCSLDTFY